jgi:hypothetical protein
MSSPTGAAPSPRIAWFALLLLLLSLSLFSYSLHLRSQDWAEARMVRPSIPVPAHWSL